jgi:hypothetical protein
MKIFLVMYRAHETSGYQPIKAFKDRVKAEFFKTGISLGESAAQFSDKAIIEEIELED